MDDVTWGALTLSLTVLSGIWAWLAFRRRGVTAGLRAAGWTLVPLALYLTDTLRLVTRIGSAFGDWALHLAFSPKVWAGLVVGGISVVLFVVSGFLRSRQLGTPPGQRGRAPAADKKALPASKPGASASVVDDDDMAEIESILRKRGIS